MRLCRHSGHLAPARALLGTCTVAAQNPTTLERPPSTRDRGKNMLHMDMKWACETTDERHERAPSLTGRVRPEPA